MSTTEQNGCHPNSDGPMTQLAGSKVREAVKNIQSKELPISPVPKPRRFSPVPSPTVPRKPLSPTPERLKTQGVQVTPPASPIRGRTENYKMSSLDARPKPPVRKRKKKFVTDDDSKQSQEGTNRDSMEVSTNRNSVSGNFVDVSSEPRASRKGEEGEEEDSKVAKNDNGGAQPEVRGVRELEERMVSEAGLQKGSRGAAEEGEECERGRFESFVLIDREEEEEEEGRQSDQTTPEISLPEEKESVANKSDSEDIPSTTTPKRVTPELITAGTSPPVSSSPSTVEGDSSPLSQSPCRLGLPASTPLANSGKKKPPPLPPPYRERPPPVPSKQQRSMRRYLTDSAVVENNGSVTAATESTVPTAIKTSPTPPESEQEQSTGGACTLTPKSPTNHQPLRQRSLKIIPSAPEGPTLVPEVIYEMVGSPGASSGGSRESLNPSNSVEVRVLTSRPETMPKHLSYGSSDSLEMSGGNSPNNRHSTIGLSGRVRTKNRSLPSSRPSLKGTRPLSDASLNLLDSYGYDVVLPPGHLQDVMKSVISNDEKMQEATIYEVVQACMQAMPHITSTRELPPHIPRMPNDTRSKVIHELYTTEYTYVHSLETLSEVFKDPLATVLGEESGRIFANVDDILAFNKGFLALLHSRLSSWEPDSYLGDLFIGMFTQSHRSMYSIYCSNYDSAEMLIHQKRKKKEFEQQLAVCLQNPRVMPGLTLAAYLITPVQRVPRYILLLKDIIQRTPEGHPDYKNLQTARAVMGELADYIDTQIRESQTKKTFDTLKNKVVGLADLDSPERSLVKEGQCFLKNIKKLYQCILFNDQLVFAHGDSRQSRVELQLPLEGVWVEDLEDLDPQTSNQDAIEVYTPDRPYTIYTQTSAEKKLWLSKLRETIYQLLLKEGKCTRSNNLDTSHRTATFVYGDRRLFTGNYVSARRHGKGTMVWPDQSKYIGDWVDDERHGEGQFTFNTREVYDGKWMEDRICGYGKMTFASDDKYIGYWKDGTRHGKGKIIYSNGDFFEGNFVNGQIEGEGMLRCRNGLEYTGSWKHSQRHGHGRLRTVLGNTYDGDFSRNQIHGSGRMEYRNGDCYDGHWNAGMRHGQGKFTSKREGVYEGTWFNDLRHGKGRQEYPNRDVYEGSWELNVRHGKGVLEFDTGEKYTGDFSYDMISGEGEMVYVDDCRYNGQWMNGLYHGQGIMVYHGSTQMQTTYNGDWRHSLRHGQGELVMFDGCVYRGLWVNDKPHGKGNYSIPTANYYYSGDWVEGKKEGRGEENSQLGLSYKGQWRNDQKWGSGEEKTLVGTTFTGHWEKSKKHGRGTRKTVTGMVEEQLWRYGVQVNDLQRRTAIDLPQLSRLDY